MRPNTIARLLAVSLTTSAGLGLVVANASAYAVARAGNPHVAIASTYAGALSCGPVFDIRVGVTPAVASCISDAGNDLGYASAFATRFFSSTTVRKYGNAGGGLIYKGRPQIAGVYTRDSVAMGMQSLVAGQTRFTIVGRVSARRDLANGYRSFLTLAVYPDSNAAKNGSPIQAGTAQVDIVNGVTYSGIFNSSQFVVTDNRPDSISIAPVSGSQTYIVAVPDTGQALGELRMGEDRVLGPGLPATSTKSLVALMALLGLGGLWVLHHARARRSA